MTSKEALLKIEAFLAYEDFQEELKAIAKDLEVLDILKRSHKIIIDNETITPEELNKIKELFEDDK